MPARPCKPADSHDPRMLALPEVAKVLGISLRTLRAQIARGALKIVRPSPKRVVVDRRDLEAFIAANRA